MNSNCFISIIHWSDSYGCNSIGDSDDNCYGNDDIDSSYDIRTSDNGDEVRQ